MARKIDPKKQFSKRLAGRAEWFWFGYMVLLVCLMAIQPDSALPAVYLGIMVTGVMMISVWAYTENSIDEKRLFWLAEIAKAVYGKSKNTDADEEESDSEGGGNG